MGKHVWTHLTDDDKAELLKRYHHLSNVDALQVGMKLPTLKRRLREMRSAGNVNHSSHIKVVTSHQRVHRRSRLLNADDRADFEKWVAQFSKPYMTIMHLCDIHFPYHHQKALNLAIQLVKLAQPDLCVVGSDEFDFMRLGKFDVDPRTEPSELDDIDLIRIDHQKLIDQILIASPTTKLVWVFGNHDYRLYRHILMNSPNTAKTVMREFEDVVRYQGRVWYLGEIDRVIIKNLIVGHGTKAGINPAKGNLEAVGWQMNYMAGHVHKLTYWNNVGYGRTTQSVTSGCLCQLEPVYQGYRKDLPKWELGTCVGLVGMKHDFVGFENIRFVEGTEKIFCVWRGVEVVGE